MVRGENARGSVSRVLSTPLPGMGDHSSRHMVTHMLKQSTRTAGPEPALVSRAIPIRPCSRWGLPCRACYQPRGALLPHPFTFRRAEAVGGLLSVALSLTPFRGAAGRYPAPWFPWSPDFPPLPCESGDRPTLWPHEYSAKRCGRRGGVGSWFGAETRRSSPLAGRWQREALTEGGGVLQRRVRPIAPSTTVCAAALPLPGRRRGFRWPHPAPSVPRQQYTGSFRRSSQSRFP